jgi:hypothetical protein
MGDVGRCELVCHALKKQAMHYWDKLDTEYFMKKHPTLRSPSAQNSREAIIRYKVASQLAERIGNFKESISKHLIVKMYDDYEDVMSDVRVDNYCQGCALPDLDFNPFRPETSNEYELFVRFCRTSDNKLLAEGFCPCERFDTTEIKLRDMDYSQWPQFAELTRLIETSEGISFANEHNDNLLDACLRDLTAVVIGVHKETSKASLSLVQCNFGIPQTARERRMNEHGIDNMGDHGFCWPKGSMSAHSHGTVETIFERRMCLSQIIISNDNRHCDAKLGLLWTNHVWNDRETGQVLKVECHWTLDCRCEYYQREY